MISLSTITTAAKPLFRWGTITHTSSTLTKLIYPSLHVGAKYDFQRARYGITRLLTTFTWGNRHHHDTTSTRLGDGNVVRAANSNHDGDDGKYRHRNAATEEGTILHVSLEKGISSNQRKHQHSHFHNHHILC